MPCSHAWDVLHSWLHVPCSQVRTRSYVCLVELACCSICCMAHVCTTTREVENVMLLSPLQQITIPRHLVSSQQADQV